MMIKEFLSQKIDPLALAVCSAAAVIMTVVSAILMFHFKG